MSVKRKRLSNKNFIFILAPIMALLFVVVIGVSSVIGSVDNMLDMMLGRGERHIVMPEGMEDWDTDYYNLGKNIKDINDEDAKAAKKAALEINAEIANEGMILLKNNGALPLAKGASVTPWGKGYPFPFYDSPGYISSMKHSYDHSMKPQQSLVDAGFNIIDYAAKLQPATPSKSSVAMSVQHQSDYDNYPEQSAAYPLGAHGQPTAAPNTTPFFANMGATPRLPEVAANTYNAAAESGNVSVFSAGQKNDIAPSTALVFISRSGSEANDVKLDGYSDGTRHYLTFSYNEYAMLRAAKKLCSKLVVLMNCTNPFELGPVMAGELEADAILWMGNPGENGFGALGKILCGEVNPSGRLYDIIPTDLLKGPEMANFGDFTYSNDGSRRFVDYAEGVYMGYRYYETAHDIGAKDPYDKTKSFIYGTLDAKGGAVTPGAVAYPFGYGMSYTTFTQSITSFDSSGDDITMTVKVTNTGGEYAGKEVVQVYYTPPYTQLDKDNKIEKPTVNLAAFGKTKLLAPGASEEIPLTWPKEEMTSYCSFRNNPDGTMGCYMLEAGDYEISLRKNSHDVIDTNTRTWTNNSTVWYDSTNPRQFEKDKQAAMDDDGTILDYPAQDRDAKFIAATNLFHDITEYMYRDTINKTPLTRKDWDNTVPINNRASGVSSAPHAASDATVALFWDDRGESSQSQVGTNPKYGAKEGSATWVPADKMPKGNQKNGLTVSHMRGKDFYDPEWELLLDQLDWDSKDSNNGSEEIKRVIMSNYKQDPIDAIKLPQTVHCEGANGIRYDNGGDTQANRDNSFRTATYAMGPVQAATWNVELLTRLGASMAAEALANGKQMRYSPAFNIHRSPFCGRNLEYFSECPILTGTIVTAILNGTTNGGLIECMKHFGLNEQETNRVGVYTWATEQTIREIYNRATEMCIRNVRKTVKYTKAVEMEDGTVGYDGTVGTKVMRGVNSLMTGQNRLGYTTPFNNYELLQRLTREEWGFTGIIMSDWNTVGDDWAQAIILAGGDTILEGIGANTPKNLPSYNTATVRTALRNTIHRIAFNVANSSAMQNAPPGSYIYYDMSPWKIWWIVAQVSIYTLVGLGGVWIALRIINERKHPEKYWNDKRDD